MAAMGIHRVIGVNDHIGMSLTLPSRQQIVFIEHPAAADTETFPDAEPGRKSGDAERAEFRIRFLKPAEVKINPPPALRQRACLVHAGKLRADHGRQHIAMKIAVGIFRGHHISRRRGVIAAIRNHARRQRIDTRIRFAGDAENQGDSVDFSGLGGFRSAGFMEFAPGFASV
ncbi:hypothetical protein SDC9_72454 [bioreactor metagenome]|uniref:Uncharacterized protein n=1 Tax=bioreactor metagenome TaxID=1076179 RepID=A0A644YHJ3_9ZZZZ